MELVLATNLVIRLGVELAALVVLGRWGWHRPAARWQRWAAAVGIPLLAATAWAVLASPDAPVSLGVGTLLVQGAVLGSAAVALVDLGRPRSAVAFAGVAVANATLMWLWGQ